jgi:hypothetical protein
VVDFAPWDGAFVPADDLHLNYGRPVLLWITVAALAARVSLWPMSM